MLALALLVCEWESTLSRTTWRSPRERDRRYLTALIGWGYKPSDVERLILAQPEAATKPTDEAQPTDNDDPTDDDADSTDEWATAPPAED